MLFSIYRVWKELVVILFALTVYNTPCPGSRSILCALPVLILLALIRSNPLGSIPPALGYSENTMGILNGNTHTGNNRE